MRILCVFAHPDDMEVHCGGTVALFSDDAEVVSLIMTRGHRAGHYHIREREAREGAEILGVDKVMFLNRVDGKVRVEPEAVDAIREVVEDLRPDLVFTHTLRDTHQDHRNTHKIVVSALSKRPRISVLAGEGPSTTPEFSPTVFFDVSETIEEKLKAVEAHESQVRRGAISREDVIKTAAYRGMQFGAEYAEAFEAVKIDGTTLLLP